VMVAQTLLGGSSETCDGSSDIAGWLLRNL
jgi:hypothetical protein